MNGSKNEKSSENRPEGLPNGLKLIKYDQVSELMGHRLLPFGQFWFMALESLERFIALGNSL